uniref:Haem-binding uptake Tiki superfamily ChaN domain-containing protein n=1 Tax=Setaria italica TaxID=4555 RepID=K3Z5A9_SETIT
MLSRVPAQSPAASFKPRHSSPRSRLGLGASCKPLTATTTAPSSTRRRVSTCAASRRGFLLLAPSLAAASAVLRTLPSAAAESDDADTPSSTPAPPTDELPSPSPETEAEVEAQPEPEELPMSRVYDATVLGEPEALAGDARGRVWEKLAAARVVYLGEAELEPDPDDRALELEVVRGLSGRCADAGRGLALALEAFPCDLQQQLDQFMDGRIDGRILKLYTSHWPQELWQQYEPLLNYCRDTGIKLIACGTPLEIITKELNDGDLSRLLIVVTGASHVMYGPRGSGVPGRISKKVPKKDQVVVLLDPESQVIRREGELPIADFLWYSAAKPCTRNCFDRAEIARVMNAAGRRTKALPQDLQKGIDLGVVSPEILQNFFDLEKYPLMAELIHRFQIIAGLVEYRLGESLVTYYNQPLIAGLLSFVARTLNSYWGTQQWVDLARYTGLQKSEEKPPGEASTPPESWLQKSEEKPPSGEASTPPELGLQKSEEKPPSSEASTPPELADLDGCTIEGHNLDDSSNNTNESRGPS